jgi:hypothetical protein
MPLSGAHPVVKDSGSVHAPYRLMQQQVILDDIDHQRVHSEARTDNPPACRTDQEQRLEYWEECEL